ncbi:MAG: extracellular solute-binding protein [Chloroflexi bacterium]|nr:extracellular solute-binding protein [Chloroflexota bacterium]
MTNKKVSAIVSCLLLLAILLACVPSRGESPTTAAPTVKPSESPVSKDPWESEWQRIQRDAKKEGEIVIYSSIGPEVREVLTKVMKEKFGVELNVVPGRAPESVARLRKEHAAGLYVADLFMAGTGGTADILGPLGLLDPLDKIIIIPEALNKSAWYGGDLLWADDDRYQIAILASPKPPIVINRSMVRPGEIASYSDLLNPKWKGKMVMEDPSNIGSGNAWFTGASFLVGLDYFRQLARQEPVIGRDSRLLAEWVARGKYPVGIAIKGEELINLKKAGTPIDLVTPKDGTYTTAGAGCLMLVTKAPHPNAARLFVNWALTKEGGAVFSKAHGYQSARLDVPTDFLEPENIRQPGIKYIGMDKPEYWNKKVPMLAIAKEIFQVK